MITPEGSGAPWMEALDKGLATAYPGCEIDVLPGTPRRAMVIVPPRVAAHLRVAGANVSWPDAAVTFSRFAGAPVAIVDGSADRRGNVHVVLASAG